MFIKTIFNENPFGPWVIGYCVLAAWTTTLVCDGDSEFCIDVLKCAPTLKIQLTNVILNVMFHVLFFYWIRQKYCVYYQDPEWKAAHEKKTAQEQNNSNRRSFFTHGNGLSHLLSGLLAGCAVFQIFDPETNAMLARHAGMVEVGFETLHILEDWEFEGFSKSMSHFAHHSMSLGLVIPMNLYYSYSWAYAYMIFTLNFCGSFYGMYHVMMLWKWPKEVYLPLGFTFAFQRSVCYVHASVLLLTMFYTDSAWFFFGYGLFAVGAMGLLNVMWSPGQFNWSMGLLLGCCPQLQALAIHAKNLIKRFQAWRDPEQFQRVLVALPDLDQVLATPKKELLVTDLRFEIRETRTCGITFGDVRVAQEGGTKLEGYWYESRFHLAQCPELVMTAVGESVRFVQVSSDECNKWIFNENGTISCKNVAKWKQLGIEKNQFALVGSGDESRCTVNRYNMPIDGLQSLDGLSAVEMTLKNKEAKALVLGNGWKWDRQQGYDIQIGDVTDAISVYFEKCDSTEKQDAGILDLGWLRFKHKDNNLAFDCAGGKHSIGTKVLLFYCHQGDNQKFFCYADNTIGPLNNKDARLGFDTSLKLVKKGSDKALIFSELLSSKETNMLVPPTASSA